MMEIVFVFLHFILFQFRFKEYAFENFKVGGIFVFELFFVVYEINTVDNK